MNIKPIIDLLSSFAGAAVANVLLNLRRKAAPIAAPAAVVVPAPVTSTAPSAERVAAALGTAMVCAKCKRVVARWTLTADGSVCANCKPISLE